ncbi:hypothetical protein BV898_15953 [Hypsibius exemplaris]|uniref:Uncharacterized protein n=1 Tax=Hypsibius exemplaris TaxID=2072580 RepID=A0A9X6RL00_HYPEX|nr:hypothetical protein BV898_15953 [Hypsibius exemplaris]
MKNLRRGQAVFEEEQGLVGNQERQSINEKSDGRRFLRDGCTDTIGQQWGTQQLQILRRREIDVRSKVPDSCCCSCPRRVVPTVDENLAFGEIQFQADFFPHLLHVM